MSDRAELDELRRLDELERKASGTPSPGPGISFVNDAEGQGYAPKPERSAVNQLGRSLGLAARSYGPLAASAGAGALLGGGIPGAAAGATAYGLTKLVGDPAVGLYNYAKPQSWPAATPPTQAINNVLDTFLPKPETGLERTTDAINQAVADSVGITGLPKVAAKATQVGANLVNEGVGGLGTFLQGSKNAVTQGVGRTLAENPIQQAALSGIGGLGYGAAREVAPDNFGVQFVAGLGTPMAAVGAANAARRAANFLGSENLGAFVTGGRAAAADTYAQNAVAKQLQAAAGTTAERDAAVQAMDDAGALTANGYLPTTGTLSGNPNLISVEKRLSNNGDARGKDGKTLLSRHIDNAQAITGGVNSSLKQTDVSPEVAQSFMGGQLNQKVLSAQEVVDAAQAAAERAAAEHAAEQAAISANATDTVRTQASSDIRRSLDSQHNDFREMSSELYSAVPKDVEIPLTNARKIAQQLINEGKGTVGGVPEEIAKFLEVTADGKAPAIKAQRNLEDLFAAAQGQPKNSPAAKQIGQLRDALDKDISAVEMVSKPLQEARTFYREQFVPRFKQGASSRVLNQRGAGGGDAVEAGKTLDAYMGTQAEAGRLKSALSGQSGELPAADAASIRDWAISKMASTLGSNPTGTQIRAWAAKNKSVIEQYPEVENEIGKMANRIGGKAQAKDQMAAELLAKQAELKSAQTTATSSNPALYSKGGAEGAVADVNSWLYKDRAGARAGELVAAAKADKSGQAMEGLRNSIKESVTSRVRSKTSEVAGSNDVSAATPENFNTTVAKVNSILTHPPTRRAMEQVFTPGEMSAMDQIRKQASVSNRLNTKATVGSDTASLTTGSELNSTINKVYWGLPGIRAAKIVKSIADVGGVLGRAIVMKNPEKVTQELLVDAMLDPKLAKALLMRETDKNLPMVKNAVEPWLNNWLQNNGGGDEVKASKEASRTKRLLGE